jgi:hypothetical protein
MAGLFLSLQSTKVPYIGKDVEYIYINFPTKRDKDSETLIF